MLPLASTGSSAFVECPMGMALCDAMETTRSVLAPWRLILDEQDEDPLPSRQQQWAFVDVPAAVAAKALALAAPSLATGRGNGAPPASWLVEQAATRHGRLCGSLDSRTGFLRFDTICVDQEAAEGLLHAVEAAWPADAPHLKSALELAEGWTVPDSVDTRIGCLT
ncbi:hypothetical protein AB2L27_19790 [Kineococcus sp. LSe6-4]|uniref:Uncharacterized protein n=1 Tax=Kineococcus halophytocola TaxID=3234027 RepID=A0ABV4H880_9ACTN